MVLKNFKKGMPDLQELLGVIEEIETPENPLNKFKNTAIYNSFKRNQRILQSNQYQKI